MGRSNVIFKGNVNKTDFDNWNNSEDDCKFLFVGYDGDKRVVKFYTAEEAEAKISKEPDYEDMKDDCEDQDELYHYYGFYFNKEDFYEASWEDDGEFDVSPVNEEKVLLIVALNI